MRNAVELLLRLSFAVTLLFLTAGCNQGEKTEAKAQPDSFSSAIEEAMEAARLTQSAHSKQDWNQVEFYWSEAISSLESVPNSSPSYTTAQTKIQQYKKNLKYAQQNIEREQRELIAIQEKLLDRIARQSGYRPRIISWGEGKTLTIPDSAWSALSKSEKDVLIEYARDKSA